MKLLSDNPIFQKDDDTFGYCPYVDILGQAIIGTKALPFTVGVFGEWGSGKTSLLRLLCHWVEDKNCKTVWFNPWKYDNKEELWAALIRSILLEILEDNSSGKDLKNDVIDLLKNLSWVLFKKAISYTTRNVISERNVEKIKNAIVNQNKIDHDFFNKFETKFGELVSKFVGNDGRLILFIDDLDRCIPENAITVLESLKLYLDNSACVFVLGMDRTVVELGIRQRYGEKIQFSGREYLEKIIQLPFFLPPVHFGNLQKTLESLSDVANFSTNIWTLLRYGLGGNPRKAKRFVNSFYMARQALDRPEAIGDLISPTSEWINRDDVQDHEYKNDHQLFYLAKVLIIQMNYTEFYDYLLFNPSGWKKYDEKIIKMSPEKRNEVLKQETDLAPFWEDRRLYFFMRLTSGEGFPPSPSAFTLERILRFTGLVEDKSERKVRTPEKSS